MNKKFNSDGLKSLRQKRFLTRGRMVKQLDSKYKLYITETGLKMYEDGNVAKPNLIFTSHLADFFGVDINYFIENNSK